MFLKLSDATGDVCINMDTGLRLRPLTENGLAAGVIIIFPDGHTTVKVRADYERVTNKLEAIEAR